MDASDEELDLMIETLNDLLPNFSVSKLEFSQPTSQFVINLYGQLIHQIYEVTAKAEIFEQAIDFQSILGNITDDRADVFGIYQVVNYVFNSLGFDFSFYLSDLYFPSSKRTKCVCKTLTIFIQYFNNYSREIYSELDSKILSGIESVKNNLEEINRQENEIREKFERVGAVKHSLDNLNEQHAELEKLKSKVCFELENEIKKLSQEQSELKNSLEIILLEEEKILKLENEENCLQSKIVSSEEIETLKQTTNELECDVNAALQEEINGFEGCLEIIKSELSKYDEIILKLNNMQCSGFSELEKLYNFNLENKNMQEVVKKMEKTNNELNTSIENIIVQKKKCLNNMQENELRYNSKTEEINEKCKITESEMKEIKKNIENFRTIKEKICEKIYSVNQIFDDINNDYELKVQIFNKACDEIIISANKTTDCLRKVFANLENKAFEVFGNQ